MNTFTQHKQIEQQFLTYIGTSTPLILKGETALMFCYGLNRFSEDLDFDTQYPQYNILNTIQKFCATNQYQYNLKKDTPTVQRVTIHYGGMQPLKIELSRRRTHIDEEETTIINNIKVYKLPYLAMMKTNAYLNRDTIRDLYDITFLINQHWENLPPYTQSALRFALAEKDLNKFELVLTQQQDNLINPEKLEQQFLKAYTKIELTPTPPQNRDT